MTRCRVKKFQVSVPVVSALLILSNCSGGPRVPYAPYNEGISRSQEAPKANPSDAGSERTDVAKFDKSAQTPVTNVVMNGDSAHTCPQTGTFFVGIPKKHRIQIKAVEKDNVLADVRTEEWDGLSDNSGGWRKIRMTVSNLLIPCSSFKRLIDQSNGETHYSEVDEESRKYTEVKKLPSDTGCLVRTSYGPSFIEKCGRRKWNNDAISQILSDDAYYNLMGNSMLRRILSDVATLRAGVVNTPSVSIDDAGRLAVTIPLKLDDVTLVSQSEREIVFATKDTYLGEQRFRLQRKFEIIFDTREADKDCGCNNFISHTANIPLLLDNVAVGNRNQFVATSSIDCSRPTQMEVVNSNISYYLYVKAPHPACAEARH